MRFAQTLVLLLGGLIPSYGSVISLQTQMTTQVHPGVLIASITLTNIGDEAARNVQIRAEFNQSSVLGPLVPNLGVNSTHTTLLRIPTRGLSPGRYALMLRTQYADLNSYPFSALTASVVDLGPGRVFGVLGILEPARLASSTRISLRLKNIEATAKTVKTWLLTPQELSVEPAEITVQLSSRSERVIRFVLRNFSARPGSTYTVYAVIENDQDGIHSTSLAPGTVRIVESLLTEKTLSLFGWLFAGVLTMALLITARVWWKKKVPAPNAPRTPPKSPPRR